MGRYGRERGHLMAALMVAVAILVILSTAAYQAWEEVKRRDLEAEMIFRAEDLCRALRRYRQDHGGQLPMELGQLMEPGTRGQYYLRKLWTDPLVKDGKWGLLYAAPGGGVFDPSAPEQEAPAGGEGLGGLRGPVLGGRRDRSRGGSRLNPGPGGSGPAEGIGSGAEGPGGGLPIAGVKSLCTKRAFRVRNEESDYAKWLFTVFDLEAPIAGGRPGAPGAGGIPGLPGGAPSPGGGPGSSGGGSFQNQPGAGRRGRR